MPRKEKSSKWIAVRTFYTWNAKGKVLKNDKNYRKNSIMLEERVVLFNCKSSSEAFKRAKAEAKNYCSRPYVNPYGEIVNYNLVGDMEAYELYDIPKDGEEVFSVTELCDSKKIALKRLNSKIASEKNGKKHIRKRFGHR